jgi:hypothetical protein
MKKTLIASAIAILPIAAPADAQITTTVLHASSRAFNQTSNTSCQTFQTTQAGDTNSYTIDLTNNAAAGIWSGLISSSDLTQAVIIFRTDNCLPQTPGACPTGAGKIPACNVRWQ